ncbi:MAG: asparaginase [Kocuria sp.]|nr:asparaginase [Kocuria sp.]
MSTRTFPDTPTHPGLEVADTVEIATVHRSTMVESRHLGAAVVTGPDGHPLAVLGHGHGVVFPRSALKPFQAATSLSCGAPIQWEQIAVAAGSHQATPEHVDSVRGILHKSALDESALQCPAVRRRHAGEQEEASPLHHPCSGKHAAFLAACQESHWDPTSYLDARHPLQREVLSTVTQIAGEEPALVGLDGCGAPVPALSLIALGRMYAALGGAAYNVHADARLATVATAMLDYPEFVHAPGAADTVIMEQLGIISKFGAEGVLCLATRSGVSVVIKTLDGSGRANHLVGLELLIASGAVDATAGRQVIRRLTETTGAQDPSVFFALGESARHAVHTLETERPLVRGRTR